MQRLLVKCVQKSKQNKQISQFCTISEQDLFNEAFAHQRNQELAENSPLKQLLNPERDIAFLKEHNEYLINPVQHYENQKQSYRQQLGENFDSFYKRGFKFEVKGLKKSEKAPEVKLPLFPNEYGQKELRLNQDSFSQLENINYLQLKKEINNNNLSHTVTKDEHFSFALENYFANEYVEKLKQNEIIIFNLPQNTTKANLQNQLQEFNISGIKNIEITNNVLGYPAFAQVTLENMEEAIKVSNQLDMKEYLGEHHLMNVVTFQDSISENSANRTLVIQGISTNVEINEVLQKLNEFGSVMHLEMVEENVKPALPSTQEVLEYLKQNYQNDNFEIQEISAGTGTTTSTKILPQKQEKFNDKKEEFQNVGDLEQNQKNKINEKSQQFQQNIASPPALYTLKWCNSLKQQPVENNQKIKQVSEQVSEDIEYVYELLSEDEKNEIRSQILQTNEYKNLGYCFVTFASVDQAKLAYIGLNKKSLLEYPNDQYRNFVQFGNNWNNITVFLKNETDHYHYDSQHLLNKFSNISAQYKKLVNRVEQKQDSNELLDTLEQKQQEVKEQILKENPSFQISKSIKDTLQNQLFTDKNSQFQINNNLNLENIGRDFQAKTTIEDIQDFKRQIQQDQTQKLQQYAKIEQLDNQNLEKYYQQKLKSVGYENLVDPLQQLTHEQKKQILENLNHQHQKELKQQMEEDKQEKIKIQNYEEQSRQMLRQSKRKNEKLQQHQQKKVQKIVRKEERQGLTNEGGAEFSVINKNQKHKSYKKFIEEIKTMIIGDFESDLRQEMFSRNSTSFQPCRDNLGNLYIDEQEIDRLFLYRLPKNEQKREEILNNYKNHQDLVNILPETWSEKLENLSEEDITFAQRISSEGIPIESYTVNLAEGESIEKYLEELNLFATEPGEEYKLIQENDGNNIIVKVLKQVQVPNLQKVLDAIANFDSKNLPTQQNKFVQQIQNLSTEPGTISEMQQQLLITFTDLGLSAEQAQLEIAYFIKNQDYSPKINALMEKTLNNITDEQLEQYCQESGMSKQDLELLLQSDASQQNLDITIQSQNTQKHVQKINKVYSPVQKQDLVKNARAIVKDQNEQYINTKFNTV
ncbi:hypothetical protein PPERSA_12709 [Pseudocohnilembus persalinus]|uniref:RRM domain-containing protein n=1 Tax=Pseudocohnilembus persalinus TaxID=266149 RepID=A0A0V0QTL6_PSEPJ|nr:hypothetical protein PPERSA_12709 [Pseudocohnilembus persalinus]|eukprot:KRX05531.1 hypothetical protein PPERSA_12709 [Pseudocohnilembus persalinus]